MVENISDFIKNIRERLASPFFFSFIISWIILNWKVSIALIWYNPNHYPHQGDLINFIAVNTSNYNSILLPLFSALVYTALLRNLISALITWTGKWGGNLNLNISKDSKVPISKFLTYRNLYIETSKNLERVIEDEKKVLEQSDKLRQEFLKIESENVRLVSRVSELNNEIKDLQDAQERSESLISRLTSQLSNQEKTIGVDLLNGSWRLQFTFNQSSIIITDQVHIENNIIKTVDSDRLKSSYRIVFFDYNPKEQKIIMHLKPIPATEEFNLLQKSKPVILTFPDGKQDEKRAYLRANYFPILIHELKVQSQNLLIGTENDTAKIIYERAN